MDFAWLDRKKSDPCPAADPETAGVPECPEAARAGRADWRKTRQSILDRARIHPCTVKHFFDLFSSPQAAYRSVARLRKHGKLRPIGPVMLKGEGRPLMV